MANRLNPWSRTFDAYVAAKKLTQRKASKFFGFSEGAIWYWRHGRIPRLGALRRIDKLTDGRVPAKLAVM